MKPGRIPCCVPFCRRTASREKLEARGHNEWLCREHWKTVHRRTKFLKRGYEKRVEAGTADAMDRMLAEKWWQACKAEAIEAAGGLR